MKLLYRISALTFLLILFNTPVAVAQFDFGDAPDPTYPTLFSNNGAHHVGGSPVFLGNLVDIDINGQPNVFANGDDINGFPDDEDGVNFTIYLIQGQIANVTVIASAVGFLDAWVDFSGNGNWTDPQDQIFVNQILNPGANALSFSVPLSANAGIYTYARFRFGSIGGMLPTGMSPDGEVEDYYVFMGAPNTGTDVIMDPDPGLAATQNELSITLEQSTGNLITAYNDNPFPGGLGIGVSYSTDQGQTWTPQQLAIPTNPFTGTPFLDAFDPTITSDDAGNTFAAHISTDANWAIGPQSGIFVHKSTNGGVTWLPPVLVDSDNSASLSPDPNYRFNDRCQIRTDKNPSSPYYNYVYLTWLKDRGWNVPQPNSDIYVSVSSDGGVSFSNSIQINNAANGFGNMPVPAVAANGDVYVLWMDYNVITGGNGIMLLDKSTDGGVTWGGDIVVDTILLPPIQLNGGSEARAKGAAVIRTHPTNSSELYITYAADPDTLGTDEGDIFFIKSTDGGTSWTAPLRINDDATTNDQVLPWMEVKANGIIDIVWYDRRNDPSDLLWDVYATSSINGGSTFNSNAPINSNSFATPITSSGPWFGEYLALTVSDTMAYVGFTSTAVDIKGDVLFTSFVNPLLTGTSENLDKSPSEIKIYPNPTNDEINIILKNNTPVHLVIVDIKGKIVLTRTLLNKTTTFDLRKFSPGIYLIKITDEEGTITEKVIKH